MTLISYPRECVPSTSINRSLKMPEKAPIRIRMTGAKWRVTRIKYPFRCTTENRVTAGHGKHHGRAPRAWCSLPTKSGKQSWAWLPRLDHGFHHGPWGPPRSDRGQAGPSCFLSCLEKQGPNSKLQVWIGTKWEGVNGGGRVRFPFRSRKEWIRVR